MDAEAAAAHEGSNFAAQAPRSVAPVDPFAVAALVLGLLWLWWAGSVASLVLGHHALARTRRFQTPGGAVARAAIALGWAGASSYLVYVAVIAADVVRLGAAR